VRIAALPQKPESLVHKTRVCWTLQVAGSSLHSTKTVHHILSVFAAEEKLWSSESLNPDGTTSAEILSLEESHELLQIKQALEVVGVLFELPGS
jgi:hypothetical protein